MKKIMHSSMVFFLAIGLFAGCASSKKAAQPHPLVGLWDYSVDTPQGVYTGVVTISEATDGLIGSISNDALAGSMDISELMYEAGHVSFKFDSGEFGILTFAADVVDDKLNGSINIDGVGEMPVTGQRKMADM